MPDRTPGEWRADQHEAAADHAAHVHQVAGLAEAEASEPRVRAQQSVEDHVATIGRLNGGTRYRAACSCGWTGEPGGMMHLALAEHAAHVHVAFGLAAEDDDAAERGEVTP